MVVDPTAAARTRTRVAATRALARRRHAQAGRAGVALGVTSRAAASSSARGAACDALIRETGRASYVIAVGPITPAKLANFAELEALCIVGADVETLETFGREVAVPLVAASELAVCLDRSRWLPEDAPFYSCDLADLAIDSEDHDSDDAPDFDLASGQCERPRVDLAYEPDQQGEIVKWTSAAAEYLHGGTGAASRCAAARPRCIAAAAGGRAGLGTPRAGR